MTTRAPYYRRRQRAQQRATDFASGGEYVDLSAVHLAPYETGDLVGKAQASFDARAAAAVSAGVALSGVQDRGPVRIWPAVQWFRGPEEPWFRARDLMELKWYGDAAPAIYLPTAKCLPALAYLDFFGDRLREGRGLRTMVSAAILAASPGWCGTFGPGIDGTFDVALKSSEGNYDMTQMRLLAMAYAYYRQLSPQAREHLIATLLARGRIHRPDLDDTFTSGGPPDDWDRAGFISPLGNHINIGETENHILMIATARYLTNQLLFQRDHQPEHDNRRNANVNGQTCTSVLLVLLRNVLRGDFSEYNSKPYQAETRWALLNLCTYAYDSEVRLASRMVLDYVSAHVAVSSNDLRRMVPFRRRNEGAQVSHDSGGSMTIGLLEVGDPHRGADPLTTYFAIQAGNTRGYEVPYRGRPWPWGIHDGGSDVTIEAVSDYRLPPSIHDLFVNDRHRRFFQRLHRVARSDEMGGNRNCDNMEIYAGSPSYLITAGGSPSGYAVDPDVAGKIKPEDQRQQLGVAVTTSFMPTGSGDGAYPESDASSLIQLSAFAELDLASGLLESPTVTPARNYGVAPDFACGHQVSYPPWVVSCPVPESVRASGFMFVDRGSPAWSDRPGFFLALYQVGDFALLEAFDTWLHPGVTVAEFAEDVVRRNPAIDVRENESFTYTTWNGNRFDVVIWNRVHTQGWQRDSSFGAEVGPVAYGDRDPQDAIGDAGNAQQRFLSGTVMSSPAEAVVEIANPFLGSTITLDMSDPWHPQRVSEDGAVEVAGSGHEVWLDFGWQGPSEGDVCRPFTTVTAAVDAVADDGAVRVLPGTTTERTTLGADSKRLRLVAPLGSVVLGGSVASQTAPPGIEDSEDTVRKDDVWVQFDMPEVSLDGPCRNLTEAAAAVEDGGVIRIVPGVSVDRGSIGEAGKRFTLAAPIGGVVLGRGIWA
ncbi:MAG: hypothetical protein ACR2JU_15290 [Nocardioidaceae bacterium]